MNFFHLNISIFSLFYLISTLFFIFALLYSGVLFLQTPLSNFIYQENSNTINRVLFFFVRISLLSLFSLDFFRYTEVHRQKLQIKKLYSIFALLNFRLDGEEYNKLDDCRLIILALVLLGNFR